MLSVTKDGLRKPNTIITRYPVHVAGISNQNKGCITVSKTRTEIEAIVQDFLTAIMSQRIKIDKCYLFGSHTRGEATENSDIDLIVVSRDFSDMPDYQRWEILGKATAKIMEPIEALALTPEEMNSWLAREANFTRHILVQPETKEVTL